MNVVVKRVGAFALAAAASGYVHCVLAQPYPTRPIRIVAASTPGSGPDVVARLIAQKLAERLGQQVMVVNRAGVGGNLGAEAVARATPDGYTLLLAMASHAIGMTLYKKPAYDLERDFAAVAPVASTPFILVTHPSLPATSVKELIALARARPGELLFGSGGAGTPPHLCTEIFKVAARISFVHVPYKGITPALVDLYGGQLHSAFSSMPAAMPFIRSARLRALGVTAPKRSPMAPGIPSVAETLPGFDVVGWYGLVVPAGTPPDVVERLHSATGSILGAADAIEQLRRLGADPIHGTSAAFSSFIVAEVRKWGKAVKDSGAEAD